MNQPLVMWSLGPADTRMLVTLGDEVGMKARLPRAPSHPRAVPWMMEAIALWEGAQAHGVVCAGGADASYGKAFWDAVGMDLGGVLYSLDLAGREPPRGPAMVDRVPDVKGFEDVVQAAVHAHLTVLEGRR